MEIKDSGNIVSLPGSCPEAGSNRSPPAQLPTVVIAIRDKVRAYLLEQTKLVFARVDDSLFTMAEKVHGQEEHDGLFQALRLLRVERCKVVERFAERINDAFYLRQDSHAERETTVTLDNLELVRNEELEQLVAADTMVSNAKRDFAEPLAEISLRLNTLFSVKIDDANNPLGPDAICDAFIEAVRPLDMHIRAHLTLLKKFDQLVMMELKGLYEACNQLLIDQGVLPSLRRQRRVANRPQSVHARGDTSSAHPAPAVASTDGAMLNHYSPGLLPPGMGLAPIQVGDLLSHLGEMQSAVPQHFSGSEIELLNISSLLQDHLIQANKSASLAKIDSDIIKLMEMLFSFIVEDRNLAEPIKSQLGRLQLPLLKVAVADKSFFSKGGHPARKLLNELAAASTGWLAGENYENDPLYRQISEVVARILADFDQDVDIFSLLLESFQHFVAREGVRAHKLESRIVGEADGRARTHSARARVAAVMEALAVERDLPSIVSEWLEKVFSHILFLTCIKDGTESKNWSHNLGTVRDLIWSVQAPMPDKRQQLLKLLPTLQEHLRVAVEMISLNPFEVRRMFKGLKDVYRERFALAQKIEHNRSAREQTTAKSLRDKETEGAAPVEVGAPEAESVAELPQMEDLEQVVAGVNLQAADQRQKLAQIPESDPHWQQTFRLAQGSWFELKRSEEEQFRCRLAAVIQDIDQFIFVNRNGAKVVEFTRLELAYALRLAQLMPLDDGMLFERALRSVIGAVRNKRSE